jgi:hypothetical protein
MLMSNDLTKGRVDYVYEDDSPKGKVIAQTPSPGAVVRKGAEVNFTVNKGTKQVEVPDVVGTDRDTAVSMLLEAGLRAGRIVDVPSDNVDAGIVVRQLISPGATVDEGTAVDFDISKGPDAPPDDGPTDQDDTPTSDDEPGDEQPIVHPRVQADVDETWIPEKPDERKLLVRITAQGTQEGQEVKLTLSDDTNAFLVVDTKILNPGDSVEIPVILTGNASVEVLHDGASVFEHTYMVQEEPEPLDQPTDDVN